jgi:DNA-binding protein H-NS
MPHSYSGWTLDKLKKEQLKIERAIELAEKRDKKATLKKMAAIANQNGFELHELLTESTVTGEKNGKSRAKRKIGKPRKKVAPKYRNPSDESQTWTGRGREPLWVKALLENGAELSDLLI